MWPRAVVTILGHIRMPSVEVTLSPLDPPVLFQREDPLRQAEPKCYRQLDSYRCQDSHPLAKSVTMDLDKKCRPLSSAQSCTVMYSAQGQLKVTLT